MEKTQLKFDTRSIDPAVRPQDDFYRYAHGAWLKKSKIPPAESRWGIFMMIRYQTERQLHALLQEMLKKSGKPGSPEQLVGDYFRSGMDLATRDKLGVAPLDLWRAKIKNLKTKQQMLDLIAELHRVGIDAIWNTGIDQDSKNSERYLLHFFQAGLGMPERDYYLSNDAESVRVRSAYGPHIEAVWKLLGYSKNEAAQSVKIVLALETRLAKAWMRKEERRDPDKTYHKMNVAGLGKLASSIDWQRYLNRTEGRGVRELIVMQPVFFKEVGAMVEEVTLEDWKIYLEYHLANSAAGLLSRGFVNENFSFYGKVLSGAKHMKPLWRRVLSVVNSGLGELIGKLYVERHFSPRAKRKMQQLVQDLSAAYERRIKALDWMNPATKQKALRKLHALNPKLGYPDRWKSFRGLVIRPNDYFGNAMRVTLHYHKREMRKLGRPIDRKEWFMYPQTVNAYFAPNLNDIVFPAAILQSPFFDPDGDDALNYGCIGSIIGHEMTHGFDDQGSKFDHKGNLKSWWTAEDRARFKKKTQLLVRQFNQYEVADGVRVNGKLTLGENVADLGGLVIAYDAYAEHLKRHPSKPVKGFTPIQRFFLAFALFERELVRPEHQKTAVRTDPHSPGVFRINGPVSNSGEFYEAFGVKKGDKLYRVPKERAKIW